MEIKEEWVTQVAKMQERIDCLENYIDRLYFAMRDGEFPTFRVDVGDGHFETVYRFIKYAKKEHPQVYQQFNAKERQEWQLQRQRRQEQKAMQHKPFWKCFFDVFLRPQ